MSGTGSLYTATETIQMYAARLLQVPICTCTHNHNDGGDVGFQISEHQQEKLQCWEGAQELVLGKRTMDIFLVQGPSAILD